MQFAHSNSSSLDGFRGGIVWRRGGSNLCKAHRLFWRWLRRGWSRCRGILYQRKYFNNPLVPHLATIGLTEHGDNEFWVWRHCERSLTLISVLFGPWIMEEKRKTYHQWEVDREPANHIFALCVHGQGVSWNFNARIQNRLKVPSQPVADTAVFARESETSTANIMIICDCGGGRILWRDVGIRMREWPSCLDDGFWRFERRWRKFGGRWRGWVRVCWFGRQEVEGPKKNHIRCFWCCWIRDRLTVDIGMEPWCWDRSKVGWIWCRDRNAICRSQDMLYTIKTFWG